MGGKSGGGEAAAARADEQARQQKIREGTQRINSIFDGQTIGTNQLGAGAAFDPSATYYTKDGSVWSPQAVTPDTYSQPRVDTSGAVTGRNTLFGRGYSLTENPQPQAQGAQTGSLIPGQKKTAAEQFAEAVASGSLYGGTGKTSGFNDDYFTKLRQNYIDYATPQLEKQYGDAQKELTFALARGGNLDSSARADKAGQLQQLYDLNKQQVADQALSYEGEARNSVENARSNLITTLNATGDAEGAANSAIARASALSKPAAYSPLSQLFADFTSGLGTQAALERANYYGGAQAPRYSTGLFTPKNAVQVK